jgi:hypothetical protein
VKKVNRKISLTVLVLATVLFATSFVSNAKACPVQTKEGFTGIQTPIGNGPGPNYFTTVTSDNIVIIRDLLGYGIINLWISPNSYPSTPSLQGTSSSVIDITINANTGEGWIAYQMTWTFVSGTFQGIIMGKLVGPAGNAPPSVYAQTDLYGIIQGTGAYKGQIILFQGSKPAGQPFEWTGMIVTG